MNRNFGGLSCLYLAVFFLSLNGLFAKLIPLDAILITQLRSSVAVCGFLAFSLFRRRTLRLQSIGQIAGIYALGLLLGVHWATFFHAMQVSTVAIGMLSLFSFPIVTILLEPFFVKKRLQLNDLVAGVVVLIGIAVMVSQGLSDPRGSVVQGVLWGVLSAILFSLRNLVQKYCFSEVSSDSLMFHQVFAVAIMLSPFIHLSELSALTGPNWGALFMLGIFSTATAHTLLTYSLKLLPAKSVALIACLQPLMASVLAWIVMSEVPQLSVAIGGGIILSVAMYETTRKR